MTAMFNGLVRDGDPAPTAVLVLFSRAIWSGTAGAHTLKKCATFPVTLAKRAYPAEPVHEPESTHEFF
jgi:hypothetical protein